MPAEDLSLEKNASLKDRKPPGLATNSTLSLPCGADHNSMPFGIQLIATFHADEYDEYLPWSVQYRNGEKVQHRSKTNWGATLFIRDKVMDAELKSIVTHPALCTPGKASFSACQRV
ncbi:hypothetical protein FEE59_25310 [Herbaspirillum sp. RU 5E]|nr:hypothetical protein [Herbaspirillum sp. RU 5E]